MEQAMVSAVTHDLGDAKLTVTGVPDRPGVAALIFGQLADHDVNVDMIVQNVSRRRADRHLVHRAVRSSRRGRESIALRSPVRSVPAESLPTANIARVSIVGAGMKTHPGVAAQNVRDVGHRQHQHRDDLTPPPSASPVSSSEDEAER